MKSVVRGQLSVALASIIVMTSFDEENNRQLNDNSL